MRAPRFLGLGLAGAILLGLVPPASSAESAFTGVAHSIDGDSLYVGGREVRLFGIDAPEYHQTCTREGRPWACGAEAAKQLSALVTNKQVRCEQVDTDEHGRIVARCTAGPVDLNRTMVATGYATAYRYYSLDYASAEESARVHRRGIWAGTFEMPRQYRQEEAHSPQGEATRRASERSNVRHGVARQRASNSAPPNGCMIKGNRGRHGWIYHLPGMPYYAQTHAEQWFCSERDARAAGYRRSRAY